jgi:copper resistance protein C
VSRWAVGLAVLAASVLATAQPAAAHDQLIETTPAASTTVAVAPLALTLRFDSDVMDISNEVVVRDPLGNVVVDTQGVVDGMVLSAPLPADLGRGTYTVAWRVVSGDGHPIQGTFEFSVGAPSAPSASPSFSPAATAAPSVADTPAGPAATGWIGLAAAAAAALTIAAVVLRRRRRRTEP